MSKRILWMFIITLSITFSVIGYWIFEKEGKHSQDEESVEVIQKNKAQKMKPDKEYDVIVIGGEPEGVAAAVSAARNGAKTLLVEHRDDLGGLFTYGMLNFLDIPQGETGESVSEGIFKEWHKLVGQGSAFGIEEAKVAFRQLIEQEPNITLLTETIVEEPILDGSKITAVRLKNKTGDYIVEGSTFIDATQDADFAVQSGVPYFIGGEDIGIRHKKMSVTLMIHLKNLDWEKIKQTAEDEKFGSAVVTNTVAWGFSDLHHVYEPKEDNTRLRGLNLAKVGDEYFINALQIFGVDGLDKESMKEGIERGKRETKNILKFLRAEFPGFENAEIASFPSELYVRETRHIWAEYQLPMSDVWTNKDHWDNIGYGAYPVDIQAQTPEDYGFIVSNPKQYAIPFRSIIPKEIDGLLVVGRAAGFSSIAAGSARVVPTGMVTGEAAGAAAALALEEDISFREMSTNKNLIKALRERLDEQGAFVKHITTSYPYEGEWFDESIQTLLNYGLIYGRYDNDLLVEDKATDHHFINLIKEATLRVNPDIYTKEEEKLDKLHQVITAQHDLPITRNEAAKILADLFISNPTNDYWNELEANGIINREIKDQIREERELKNKEMFAICASLIEYLKAGR